LLFCDVAQANQQQEANNLRKYKHIMSFPEYLN
jgi:hypothetical protein